MDSRSYDKALESFFRALKMTDSLKDNILKSAALCNIGICMRKQKNYDDAGYYLKKAVQYFAQSNSRYLPKAIYNLMYVKVKQNKISEAGILYEKGQIYSEEMNDEEYKVKLDFLKGLYLESINEQLINEAFTYLQRVRKYSDVSELASEMIDYYNENKDYKKSVIYYEIYRKAEDNIKKGENFFEN